MRTLKKTLCLVLALAMMVGLCAVGASAVTFDDYPDKDSIKHPQAVKVMTAIGVLQGDDRGFRGQDSLNRAEGATFFTKLCAQTGAGIPSFIDMAGYEWANGPVAFCEQNNIIAGFGDGTFRPGDPISYVQWLKMGLVALGYDPIREGLVGDQWEINTIKLVNKLNLTKGIDNIADYNAPIPRDDAAQVGLNILQAGMVEYNGGLSVITPDGTKVETGANATYVENNSYDYRNFIGADVDDEDEYNRLEFCENYFPNLKRATRWDDFGYPTYNWYLGKNRNDNTWMESKEIAVSMAGGILAEYDTPATVTYGTIYTDAGVNATTELTVLENGSLAYLGANDITLKANDKTRLSKYAGASAILVDVDEDGQGDWLAVKYAYPATVTAVTEAAKSGSGKREVTLKVYNNVTGVTVVGWPSETLNKFDVVMAYPDGTIAATGAADKLELLAVEPAETAKGTLSKIGLFNGAKTTLTIDGVLYPVGAATLANMGVVPGVVTVNGSELVVSKTYTVYMNNGCVLGIAGEQASYDNFVFVVGSVYKSASDVTKPDAAKIADTGIVKQDGTTEVLTSAAEIDKAWYTTLTVGGMTTFTSADKGALAKNVERTLAAGTKIQKDKPTLADGITTDSKTVFVFYTGATGGYKTYTGIANVPSYELKNATTAYALVGVSDGMTKAVFINLSNEEPTNVSTEKIFILSAEPSSTAFDDTTKKTLNVFPAVIDGAFGSIQTTMSKDDMAKFAGKVVTPTRDDTGSYIKALTEVTKNIATDTFETEKGIVVSNGTITFAGRAWTTNDSTQVFYWDNAISTKNVEAGALTDLIGLGKTGAAVKITGVYSATSDTLSAIYVVNAPATK